MRPMVAPLRSNRCICVYLCMRFYITSRFVLSWGVCMQTIVEPLRLNHCVCVYVCICMSLYTTSFLVVSSSVCMQPIVEPWMSNRCVCLCEFLFMYVCVCCVPSSDQSYAYVCDCASWFLNDGALVFMRWSVCGVCLSVCPFCGHVCMRASSVKIKVT